MKTLLQCLFLGCTLQMAAQPTYPASSYASAGETIEYKFAGIDLFTFDVGQTGADVTWNFSDLSPISTENIGVLDPNNAGYKLAWCFSHTYLLNCNSQFNAAFNLARNVENGYGLDVFGITNPVEHLNKTSAQLEAKMFGATVDYNGNAVPVTLDYTDTDTVLQFPLTYGQNFTDTSTLGADLNTFDVPVVVEMAGTRTVEVDGWGTLQLPNGTLTNVLRVHTSMLMETEIDYMGIPLALDDTLHSYAFYHADYGLPVLQIDGLVNEEGVFEAGFIRYVDVVLATQDHAMQALAIYPNPATDSFAISGLANNAVQAIRIYNQLGQLVGQSTSIAHLNQGIYTVEIETSAGKKATRLVKQ